MPILINEYGTSHDPDVLTRTSDLEQVILFKLLENATLDFHKLIRE